MPTRAHLQVLCNVENASDVEGAIFVETPKCIGQIRRTDLPDAHEHQLVVGVAGKEHR
jgi:hypothetical protein